jgi:hypothetical protein
MKVLVLERIPIQRFDVKGDKTSWSFIEVLAEEVRAIHATDKKSFRGKGCVDDVPFAQVALMPMGKGNYILPINAAMRKSLGKKPGDFVRLQLEKDIDVWRMNADLEACLLEVPETYKLFCALPPGHQRYFSNWIESTKNPTLRADRIFKTIFAVENKMDYGAMIRHFKNR